MVRLSTDAPPLGPTGATDRTRNVITVLTLASAAQFVLQLDFSVVNVALPTIQRQLAFAPAELQWIVTGYALTFGSLLLFGGRLGDLLGRRRLLALGLGGFAIASLTCGLSVSAPMLIGARLVQGAAAAFVSTSALALLAAGTPEGPVRTRALSLFQAATAAGASAGVVAGGVIVDFLGWRWIFLVNVPIAAALLLLIPSVIPNDSSTGRPRLDVLGAVLATASAAALIFGLSNGEQAGFVSVLTLVSLVAAVLLALAFVAVERRSSAPLLPFSYFRAPTHRAAIGATALVGAITVSYPYFVSLYLQNVLRYSPLLTGLSLLPSPVTVIVVTVFATRRLVDRLGVKWALLLGLSVMAIGQLWLAQLNLSGGYLVNVLPGQVLTATGVALSLPAASIGATSGVNASEQGVASGLFNSARQIGGAVGLAMLATVAAARTTETASLSAGYALSYLVASGFALLAALWVASRLSHAVCQAELARKREEEHRSG